MNQLFGLIGIAAILGIAWLLSTNRKAIRLRVVAAAFALQAGIAVLVIYTPWGAAAIQAMSNGVANLLGYAEAGHRVPVRAVSKQSAGQHLRHRGAAGDHLLRLADRDPLPSRHHAAGGALGGRRDRVGDRHQPRRIAFARRPISSSASRNRPLTIRPYSPL